MNLGNAVLVRRSHTAPVLLRRKRSAQQHQCGLRAVRQAGLHGTRRCARSLGFGRSRVRFAHYRCGSGGAEYIVLPVGGSFRSKHQPPSASVIVRTDAVTISARRRPSGISLRPRCRGDHRSGDCSEHGWNDSAGEMPLSASPARMMNLEPSTGSCRTISPRRSPLSRLRQLRDQRRRAPQHRQATDQRDGLQSDLGSGGSRHKETGSQQNNNSRAPVGVEQNVQLAGGHPSGDQSKRSNERREELTNFEVSSKTTSTVSEGYKIDQLTVAVVINRKRLLASLGEGAGPEAVEKQLKDVERLIESAAGIDAKRGDRITVSAVEFLQGSQPLEPDASSGIVDHSVAIGQHRQCAGDRRCDGVAHYLVRAAAGDAGNPGGQAERAHGHGAAAGAAAARGVRHCRVRRHRRGSAQPDRRPHREARAHTAEAARADDRLRRGPGGGHPQAVDAGG